MSYRPLVLFISKSAYFETDQEEYSNNLAQIWGNCQQFGGNSPMIGGIAPTIGGNGLFGPIEPFSAVFWTLFLDFRSLL